MSLGKEDAADLRFILSPYPRGKSSGKGPLCCLESSVKSAKNRQLFPTLSPQSSLLHSTLLNPCWPLVLRVSCIPDSLIEPLQSRGLCIKLHQQAAGPSERLCPLKMKMAPEEQQFEVGPQPLCTCVCTCTKIHMGIYLYTYTHKMEEFFESVYQKGA